LLVVGTVNHAIDLTCSYPLTSDEIDAYLVGY